MYRPKAFGPLSCLSYLGVSNPIQLNDGREMER
jgi:hypothetical protein